MTKLIALAQKLTYSVETDFYARVIHECQKMHNQTIIAQFAKTARKVFGNTSHVLFRSLPSGQ